LLNTQAIGTYLIRLSKGSPGQFVIAYKGADEKVHQVMVKSRGAVFLFEEQTFKSMQEVVLSCVNRGAFKRPGNFSMFQADVETAVTFVQHSLQRGHVYDSDVKN